MRHLEATAGYGGAADDKLDIAVGFARDMAGNAATTDALLDGSLFHTGQSVIDLGSYGKLIAPVQVEAEWYYYWDRSGDGTSADTGTLNGGTDKVDHNKLDLLFTKDSSGATGGAGDTTDTYRYGSLNGVGVALPTVDRGTNTADTTLSGTPYSDSDITTNGTFSNYDGLLAVWDAYNGTGTTSGAGLPTGWGTGTRRFSSATPGASGASHVAFNMNTGVLNPSYSDSLAVLYVALVVL